MPLWMYRGSPEVGLSPPMRPQAAGVGRHSTARLRVDRRLNRRFQHESAISVTAQLPYSPWVSAKGIQVPLVSVMDAPQALVGAGDGRSRCHALLRYAFAPENVGDHGLDALHYELHLRLP